MQFSLCRTVVQGNIAKWYLHIPHAVTFFYNVWQRVLWLWYIQLTVIMHWWSVHVNRVNHHAALKNERHGSLSGMVQCCRSQQAHLSMARTVCCCPCWMFVTVRRECREKTHDIVLFSGEGKMQGVTLIIHRMLTHSSCECGDIQHTCMCCVVPRLCIMED